MRCPTCGWEMLPPKCQNPDCKRGNKDARPATRPLMRTQRGYGGRVRTYLSPGDATIEDRRAQGRDAGWDVPNMQADQRAYENLSPALKARVNAEVEHLERTGHGFINHRARHPECRE